MTRPRSKGLMIVAAVLAGLCSAGVASAFECKRSESYEFVSLGWEKRAIGYYIEANSGFEISPIQSSFSAWGEQPCTDLEFEFLGELSAVPDDANFVTFVESGWSGSERPPGAVALTITSYGTTSGVIQKGVIEINQELFDFGDVTEGCTVGSNNYDLIAVVTHEVGHFVGFDHSQSLEATMAPVVDECEADKRTLAQDDLEGVCSVYPRGQPRTSCDPLPKVEVASKAFACTSTAQDAGLWGLLMLLGGRRIARRRAPSG